MLTRDTVRPDPRAWQGALAELALLPRLLAPFDRAVGAQQALYELAVARRGPVFRVPLTRFVADHDEQWRAAAPVDPAAVTTRRAAVLRLFAESPAEADGVVRIPAARVRELTRGWLDPATAADGYACYVQPRPGPAGLSSSSTP